MSSGCGLTRALSSQRRHASRVPRGGRARKGKRLPSLAQVLTDAGTGWQPITVSNWYGTPQRWLEICSQTAVWFHSGQTPLPVRWVLLRDPLGKFEPQALLCTDPMRDPLCVIGWFMQRWSVEVTFREVRDHLGFESQRQWSDPAIARTTPCLLGLFSLVALFADRLVPATRCAVSTAAWYRKQRPTFADTLAAVRREIWKAQGFSMSRKGSRRAKTRAAFSQRYLPCTLLRCMINNKWPKSN